MKSEETVVQKIHREFREAINTSTIKIETNEDVELFSQTAEFKKMLEDVGMVSSKAHQEASKVIDKCVVIKANNTANQELLANQAMFPTKRLIGINRVIEICEKYDLYIGYINQYNGDIPEKNLRELTEFDAARKNTSCYGWNISYNDRDWHFEISNNGWHTANMLIVAPLSLLNVNKNTLVVGRFAITNHIKSHEPEAFKFKLQAPSFNPTFFMDPIVLFPSINNSQGKFFNIVTAWGDEADDEYVTNKIKLDANNQN